MTAGRTNHTKFAQSLATSQDQQSDEALTISHQFKPCKSCGGRGWFYPIGYRLTSDCKACNGTGDADGSP